MKAPIVISERPNLSLDLLTHLRDCDLYSSKFGAPDELLLHSGGPTSDLSKRSLLMGPSRMRFIVKQPQESIEPSEKSPLSGDFDLLSKPTSMIIEIEVWDNAWISHHEVCGADFADTLRKLEPYLPEASGVNFQPGGLAGLLTYDMVRYTEPLRLQSTPEPGSILMILYRVDRWIIHDRENSTM